MRVFFQGTEDCGLDDCFLDSGRRQRGFCQQLQPPRENRRAARSPRPGASAICFVGDPKAVRYSADEYGKHVARRQIDTTPGPKTDNYPADCRVEDCLLHGFGVFEKQTAGVEIAMAEAITVSHASIYDCPARASTSATAAGAAT